MTNIFVETLQSLAAQAPNAVGELLRVWFFDSTKGYGCYSTFELRSDVTLLPSEPVEYYDDSVWTRATKGGIEMRYFWDGDGTLEFTFPNGTCVVNDDCKKDRNWAFEDRLQEDSND